MNDDPTANVPFVVYTTDGTIQRTGTCPRSMVAIQAGEGELAMEGAATDLEHSVIGGKITKRLSKT
jgi:hypothetical protein